MSDSSRQAPPLKYGVIEKPTGETMEDAALSLAPGELMVVTRSGHGKTAQWEVLDLTTSGHRNTLAIRAIEVEGAGEGSAAKARECTAP